MDTLLRYLFIITCSIALLAPGIATAQRHEPNVTGNWATIDDETGKARSIVSIYESRGTIYGRITKVFPQPGDTGFCRNCPGAFKDKPVQGLRFMWGLRQTGDRTWSGGHILDPKKGKIYRVKLTLSRDGRALDVRGYIGVSLLGRTQTWHRRR